MIKKGKKKKCNQLERIHFPLGYTIHVDCLSDFMLVSLLFIYLFCLATWVFGPVVLAYFFHRIFGFLPDFHLKLALSATLLPLPIQTIS